jgi:hypothetical protein
MGKVWVLDTETKGTGANVVPLEKTLAEPAPKPVPRSRKAEPKRRPGTPATSAKRARAAKPVETSSSPLPPGHVRKKGTGEIGRVQSIDPKAGTATVLWLKRGGASTVPLSAISRR